MSLRLFATMLFFSLTVLWPIHKAFDDSPIQHNSLFNNRYLDDVFLLTEKHKDKNDNTNWSYLWSYLVFTLSLIHI